MPFIKENIERYTIEELEDILNINQKELNDRFFKMTIDEQSTFMNNVIVLKNRLYVLQNMEDNNAVITRL